jgi:hypothetical protein
MRLASNVSYTLSVSRPHLLFKVRFLQPSELMAAHGFHGYDFGGLAFCDQMGLIGRGMSATSLAVIFAASLKAMKAVPSIRQ